MWKKLCKIITIASFMLSVTSTAVFAADKPVPGVCNSEAAVKEALAAREAAIHECEQAYEELRDKYEEAYLQHYLAERQALEQCVNNIPVINAAKTPVVGKEEARNSSELTFHQDGWYVARLEVQVWDNQKQNFVWIYSDSCAIGQKTTVKIDTDRYEINRVGYQIWFFGWDNDYMNIPWANTDYATDFTLSGSGDYPEFTWR